ncbi:NAD-dependent epimerase/dehydratase family protein [Calderihabitans maritimus]|uniref:NAD-dependent epimerase/dehydratase n=1 Tax=Calderihabitans maritimus TaxID=1246530 RepID=A0A1Z5HXB4_9FIRM|nr:SDR family oxidoreductase [Calderihabitans maritimus]GAW94058.1 NAD-dependent epimerase/dehydratase [Calderihabitans maritimus]
MKVLVTGGGGYIGSVLTRLLLERGHRVRCLDRFFFGKEVLEEEKEEYKDRLELVQGDIRWVEPEVLEGVDAVMDLAALSNDPTGELDPQKTMDINYRGRARMAEMAKEYGVNRYILASSCSIYGFQEGILDENSPARPLTTYARANYLAERAVLSLLDENFKPVALRQATVYGLSKRMRFDLAVNGMTLGFFKQGKIPILRDGTQWRPFVHVRDTAKAFIMAMEADPGLVGGQVFNVGANEQNYQIYPLAELVAEATGLPFAFEWYGSPDHRSYRVSFDRIKQVLGYHPDYTPADGAREIYAALKDGRVVDSTRTITLQWYKHLLETHKFIHDIEMNGVLL